MSTTTRAGGYPPGQSWEDRATPLPAQTRRTVPHAPRQRRPRHVPRYRPPGAPPPLTPHQQRAADLLDRYLDAALSEHQLFERLFVVLWPATYPRFTATAHFHRAALAAATRTLLIQARADATPHLQPRPTRCPRCTAAEICDRCLLALRAWWDVRDPHAVALIDHVPRTVPHRPPGATP